jgi:hypothetical protein
MLYMLYILYILYMLYAVCWPIGKKEKMDALQEKMTRISNTISALKMKLQAKHQKQRGSPLE